MQEDIRGPRVLRRLTCEAFFPMAITVQKLLVTLLRGLSLQPACNRLFVKLDENPFTKLLDRRQPVGVTGNRRATNGQLNILDLSISTCRSGLEAREAIKAGDLP